MDIADAKRFEELESENTELKKMLADERLKNRVLNETLEKSGERLREAGGSEACGRGWSVLGAPGLPLLGPAPFELPIPREGGAGGNQEAGEAHCVAEPEVPSPRLPADPSPAATRGLEGRAKIRATHPEAGSQCRETGPPVEARAAPR